MNLLHLLNFSEETIQMLNMLLMEIEYLFRLLSFINMLFITILSILTWLLAKLWQCHTSLPITYACKSLTFLSSCSLHRLFSAVWQNVFWLTNFWQFISHFGESFRITCQHSHCIFTGNTFSGKMFFSLFFDTLAATNAIPNLKMFAITCSAETCNAWFHIHILMNFKSNGFPWE